MKERPILFKPPMVRAIIEGRKIQTRRVVKIQNLPGAPSSFKAYEFEQIKPDGRSVMKFGFDGGEDDQIQCICPYGRPGDYLWVRETWGYFGTRTVMHGDNKEHRCRIRFYADEKDVYFYFDTSAEMFDACPKQNLKYPANYDELDFVDRAIIEDELLAKWWKRAKKKPSIHLPRRLSRIDLLIKDIRIEKLQSISEEDALAEGIDEEGEAYNLAQNILDNISCIPGATHDIPDSSPAKAEFRHLWDSINGNRASCSWSENPWVWVVEFEMVKP